MSKPTQGFVPPSKPPQGPTGPRLRPLPRSIPTRPPRLQQAIPEAFAESVEAKQASEAAETRTLWQTIIKRKKAVYAIGFGIVVVAGTILGARLKETKQQLARRQELEEAARKLAESSAADGVKEDDLGLVASTAVQAGKIEAAAEQPSPVQRGAGYNVDVARQITLLEDRKALLNRQKNNIEQKIQRLRERTARREEMEARRPSSIQVDR